MQKKNSIRRHSPAGKRFRKTKRTSLLLLLLIPLLPAAVLLTTKAQAEGMKEPETYKYYTSIRVDGGDTLWEIAEEYRTEEYEDINSYIDEVKKINHLSTSKITDGMYLCIPYYTQEYKS